jgi:hypothetical protein
MLKSATPEGSIALGAGGLGGRQLTVRELLDNAAKDLISSGDTISPLVAADTHLVLAEAYSALTEYVKSEDHARMAYEAAASTLGDSSEVALQACQVRVLALVNLDRGGEGIDIGVPALERARAHYEPDAQIVIDLCQVIGACYIRKPARDAAKGEAWVREAVALSQQRFGPDHDRTAHALQTLAYVLGHSGNKDKIREAVDVDRRVLAIREERLGPDHPRVILTAKDLGRLLFRAGDFAGSVAVQEPRLPIARRVLGPDHLVTISLELGLAESLEQVGRIADTLPYLDHAYAQLKLINGVHQLETLMTRHQYARMLLAHGDCDKAETLIQEQEQAKAVYGEGHLEPTLTFMRFRLALCRHDLPAMEKLVERLRGTNYEDEVREAFEQERARSRESAGKS